MSGFLGKILSRISAFVFAYAKAHLAAVYGSALPVLVVDLLANKGGALTSTQWGEVGAAALAGFGIVAVTSNTVKGKVVGPTVTGPAANTTVGTVSVTVVPDTSRFVPQLRAAVDSLSLTVPITPVASSEPGTVQT